MKSLWITITLTLFSIIHVQSSPDQGTPSFLETGKCASFSLVDDFQIERYLGRWYYAWSVPSTYVKAHTCAVDIVTMTGKKMKVVTKGFTPGGSRARTQAKLNYVVPKSTKKPYMQLEATSIPAVPYVILATDYTSYSCIYSCYNIIGLKAEFYWIYSRTPEIAPEAQQKCFTLFESGGLDLSRMVTHKHGRCNIQGYFGNETDVNNVISKDNVQHKRRVHETYSDDEDVMEEGSGNFPDRSSSNLEASHHHHHGKKGRMSTALEEAILVEEDLERESKNIRKHVTGHQYNSSSSSLTSKALFVSFVVLIINFLSK
ncbi:crustacyanin-A2 subunit-like [Palaemon carinicauda]|uniref:crustacyanin-A2 subunit-like n=1 Tax=Palaemon carinicauda TaxID=392227 RepID=UPI0035B5FBD5